MKFELGKLCGKFSFKLTGIRKTDCFDVTYRRSQLMRKYGFRVTPVDECGEMADWLREGKREVVT